MKPIETEEQYLIYLRRLEENFQANPKNHSGYFGLIVPGISVKTGGTF